MYKTWKTDNHPCCIYITIKTKSPKKIRVFAQEQGRPNSKYADRTIEVSGTRTIYFSFPVVPKDILFGITNVNNESDKDFEVSFEQKPLKRYDYWSDSETNSFVQLALKFSQTCGFQNPTEQEPVVYQTKNKQFTIKLVPVIRDGNGAVLSTPARIGHTTGLIETAQCKFNQYTIPMRMAILLHEFSHKYKNPKMGLQINNEIGADINALYIYLGMGFSKVDAIWVFGNVFLKAQTPQNIERMRKIMDYIGRYEKQEFAQLSN